MAEESAEEYLSRALKEKDKEPESASEYLNQALSSNNGEPEDAESFLKQALSKTGSLAMTALSPIEAIKKPLMAGAAQMESSDAFGLKMPTSPSPIRAAIEAAKAVIALGSAPVEPLTRPGGPFQPTKVAETLAPSPFDAIMLAVPGASAVAGRLMRPGVKAAVNVAEAAAKPIEGIMDATARLEAAAARAPKEATIQAGKQAYPRIIVPEPIPQSPLPKHAININLERINTTDDVKQFMLDISASNRIVIDEAKRGVITNKQTLQLANDLGVTPEHVLKRLPGDVANAEGITAARQVLAESAENTLDTLKSVALGRRSLSDGVDALRRAVLIQAKAGGLISETGRALQAASISVGGNKEKAIKAFMNALGGQEITEEIVQRLAKLDPLNPREFNIALREISEGGTRGKVFEAWISGLLSGPGTHIANSLSNALAAGLGPIEKAGAGALDFFRASFTGGQQERFAAEAFQQISGIVHGIPQGFSKALRAWSDEVSEFSSQALKVDVVQKKAIKGGFGKAARAPLRLLGAVDEFFKAINYSSHMSALAYRDAAKQGLKGQARLDFMADFLSKPTADTIERSIKEARYRTFTKEAGPGTAAFMRWVRTAPGAEFIFPFVTTPVNVAKFGLERTPLNFLIRTPFRIGKGVVGGGEASEELARGAIGMLAASQAGSMYGQGTITGGGPRNPGERNVLLASGWKPYSLKIGNKYVSYARFEPLAMTMGLTADVLEMSAMLDKSDMASKLGLAFANNITNKTFTRGLSDAINAISRPEIYGESWMRNAASSALPMTGALKSFTQMMDPTMKRPQSIKDAMKSRIPGLSEDVMNLRDIWGKPVIIEGGPIRRGLAANIVHSIPDDFSTKEMARLKMSIPHLRANIGGVELSDAELDRYAEVSGSLSKQYIDEFTSMPGYSDLDDDTKTEKIQQLYNKGRNIARKELFPNLKEDQYKIRGKQ